MKNQILNILKTKILVSDGALGTALMARGLKSGECPDLWCKTHPEDIKGIVRGYVSAGSDIISTNSFGANRFKLSHYGLENDVHEINFAAAKIAKEVAGEDVFVAGSIGPTGKMLLMGDVTEKELFDAYKEQIAAIYEGGADLVLIETISDIEEAAIAVKAAKDATPLPVAVTFAFDKTLKGEYRTMMGVSPTEMTQEMKKAGADIVGANCGSGIENMPEITKEIRAADPDIFIMIQPNAGVPQNVNGKDIYPESPEQMAENTAQLVQNGANIIGGCCGTTPAHIKAIKEAL